MQIKPLHDRVLVEPLDAEEKTAGGIIITDLDEAEAAWATGFAIGNDVDFAYFAVLGE